MRTMSDLEQTAKSFCEKFIDYGTRFDASSELALRFDDALQILKLIFDGEIKNQFGISYIRNGIVQDCSLITIKKIGERAKPLEIYVRSYIDLDHPYALQAIQDWKNIELETRRTLARGFVRNIDNTLSLLETGLVICKMGLAEDREIIKIINRSAKAKLTFGGIKQRHA